MIGNLGVESLRRIGHLEEVSVRPIRTFGRYYPETLTNLRPLVTLDPY